MRFNICGFGLVPGINALAPMRNIELSKDQVMRILHSNQFKVYTVYGVPVNISNVTEVFMPHPIHQPTVVVEPKVEEVVPVMEEPVVVEEVFEETVTEEDAPVEEETVVETKKEYYNYNKKNKKR